MKKLLLLPCILLSFTSICFSAQISQNDLLGEWTFVYWMEEGDETSKRDINIIMDFQKDGSVITKMGNKTESAKYKVEGETILYTDKRGQQVWKIISFDPGKSFKVNHKGAEMYFSK